MSMAESKRNDSKETNTLSTWWVEMTALNNKALDYGGQRMSVAYLENTSR